MPRFVCAAIGLIPYLIFQVITKMLQSTVRDFRLISRWGKCAVKFLYLKKFNRTVHDEFNEIAKKNPNKICFIFEDEKWTFAQVEKLVNKVANYFIQQGFIKGDTIGILMENRIEYVCLWLGLAKIGVISALVNTNLRRDALLHFLKSCKCTSIIFGSEFVSAIEEISGEENLNFESLYEFNTASKICLTTVIDLNHCLEGVSSKAPIINQKINFSDVLLYIGTSGTTGLPKASIIKHSRYMMLAYGCHTLCGLIADNIHYSVLPFYHGAPTITAVGQALFHGSTVVIARKFSATRFWNDCRKHKVTAFQYIGELCRFLLRQPENDNDKIHSVQKIYGNGLRPEIWADFVKRFNIKNVAEYYSSTEGNCSLSKRNFYTGCQISTNPLNVTQQPNDLIQYTMSHFNHQRNMDHRHKFQKDLTTHASSYLDPINIDNKIGAVGYIPKFIDWLLPCYLIKIHKNTGEPLRNPLTGLCNLCGTNEPGEFIGMIKIENPMREFAGYTDEISNNKKIIINVLRQGDQAFRSGDILMKDSEGYFYFKDRQGDTFRWKGENVSTLEVEVIVSKVCGYLDTAAYGVEIPGCDGRAGMIAIADPEKSIDLDNLAGQLKLELPPYAMPLFLRIVNNIDMTGSHRVKKVQLQNDGFDITRVKDQIYFYANSTFVPLDSALFEKIMERKIRI